MSNGVNELDNEVNEIEEHLESFKEEYETLEDKLGAIEDIKSDIEKRVDVEASNIDFDRLAEFVKDKYWLVNEIGENEYEIWMPQFMDVQVGVLDRQVGGYNVFILDQTTKLISGIPEFLQDEVEISDEDRFKVKEDLLEFQEEQRDVVEQELDEYVEDVKDDKATIKQDKGHELIRELLERGEMPFTPMPVKDQHYREPETEHELRDYQDDAYQEWLDHGALTVAYMTGAGKTHIGMEALESIRYGEDSMRKAVVVYSKITEKKWRKDIQEFAPRLSDEVEIYTYQALHKLEENINEGKEYGIVVFDEADFLPANTFSRASTYPIKYRMGLTASPKRSDREENDVFALCGKPMGMNWKENAELMDKKMHEINIHTVPDTDSKLERIRDLIDPEKTTMIFVDFIDEGEWLSEHLDLKFVHGETSNQLSEINNAIEEDNAVIVSRIADRGISIGNLERLIEIPSYDSGRQAVQRTGRLLHGEGQSHDMVYTPGVLNKHEERFYRLIEKGFKLNDIDDALEIQDLEDRYESKVDVEFEYDESEVEDFETESSTSQGVPSDALEFLKDDEIQEIINDRISHSRYGRDPTWEALIAIAKEDDGLTHSEIEELLDVKQASTMTKPFREDPALLSEGKDGKLTFEIEKWQEIKRKEEEKQEKKQEIEELKSEVLG